MEIQVKNDHIVVKMPSGLTGDTLAQAKEDFSHVLKQEAKKVVLNMEHITHIYSLEIGLIVHLYKEIQAVKGQLFIANVNQKMEDILCSVNLDKIIPIFRTIEEFEMEKEVARVSAQEQMELETEIRTEGGCTVVHLKGTTVSVNSYKKLQRIFDDLQKYPQFFILDFRDIDLLDSQALGFLVEFAKKVQSKEGVVAIAQANDILIDLFKIFELEDLFPFFPTIDAAYDFLRSRI